MSCRHHETIRIPSKQVWFNFVLTLLQICSSLAIILIVRYALGGYWSTTCLAATQEYPWTCRYGAQCASVRHKHCAVAH